MEVKHPIESKTLHMNLVIMAALPFLPADKKNDPEFLQCMIAICSLLNMIIRFFSNGKLDFEAE